MAAAEFAIALTVALLSIGFLSAHRSCLSATQHTGHVQSELLDEQRKLSEFSLTSGSFNSLDADKRKALQNESMRWPNAVVPYFISPSVGKISSARQVIKGAMDHWQQETCIRFVPATAKDIDFVKFVEGKWCCSYVGRVGGPQNLMVNKSCLIVGTIVHELGHAIGWVHEHMRPDRDNNITINYTKVDQKEHAQYEKQNDSYIDTFGLPYDHGSIMHYSGGSGAITALDPEKQNVMGQRVRLSFYDIKLANLMYKCAQKNKCNLNSLKCIGEGYVGPKCTCVCPVDNPNCTAESGSKKVVKGNRKCPGSWCTLQ